MCALKVLNPTRESDGPADPEFHRRFFLEASTAVEAHAPQHGHHLRLRQGRGRGSLLHRDGVHRGLDALSRAPRGRASLRSARRQHRPADLPFASGSPPDGRSSIAISSRANVMLSSQDDEHDTVKVLDFGLVKDVSGGAEELTQAGLFMGSPKYMSPEQITGATVTAATDVYSLGVLLFEMLTGKAPFDRSKSVMTLMAHVNEAVPLLAEIFPGITVSQATEAIVYRCLEKDPALRYQTMDEVLLFGALEEGQPTTGEPGRADSPEELRGTGNGRPLQHAELHAHSLEDDAALRHRAPSCAALQRYRRQPRRPPTPA